jgi:heat shock protein HslJ
MRSASYLPQLLTVFVVSAAAAAQSPFGFPLNQRFVAISLNGQDYAAKSPTLSVNLDANRNVLTGAGFSGCNTWRGEITLGDRQFGVGDLGTTKMYCADHMVAEVSFLTALKSVTRWHMDGPKLVLEGERTSLLLAPAAPTGPDRP